jgi:hypothetical protein
MALFPKLPIRRVAGNRFEINLSDNEREVIAAYLEQLRELLLGRDDALRRLFPVAYLNDPEADRDYQELMHGDLLESRFAAIETMEETLQAKTVDEDQLTQWMQAINALRLVVGTRLDVGEELPAVDPDDPDFMFYVLYESLGELLYYIVAALTPGLPEPTRTDPRF